MSQQLLAQLRREHSIANVRLRQAEAAANHITRTRTATRRGARLDGKARPLRARARFATPQPAAAAAEHAAPPTRRASHPQMPVAGAAQIAR